MKISRLLAVVLSVALLLSTVTQAASAANRNNDFASNVSVGGNLALYGDQDADKRFNLQINTDTMTADFALVYLDNPDYMYEYSFALPSARATITSKSYWDTLISICFDNLSNWKESYIPSLVTIIEADENTLPTRGESEDITYFENYLTGKYGSEYYDSFLRSTTISGVLLNQKQMLDHYVYRDRTYLIAATITVAGFITGILGLFAGPGLLAALGFIAGTGGLFFIGDSIREYTLRTILGRYVTVSTGTYPYAMADRFTYFTGFVNSRTDFRAVDTDSEDTFYIPSLSYFNSYSSQFSDAYSEYLRIGWMG